MSVRGVFVAGALVAPGAKVAEGYAPQDHAAVRVHDAGVVLAVADGVTLVEGRPSCAQVGAYLCAELAAEGALTGLRRGASPGDTRGQAAAALHHGLLGIWTELPREAAWRALASTTVLAVVTSTWSAIWLSGDGAFGLIAPASTKVHGIEGQPVAGDPRFAVFAGARQVDLHGELASLNARRSVGAAAGDLRTMLYADGPVLGAYVATDGLRHEAALERRLRYPVRTEEAARALLVRPSGCDDLAVAWASERQPGLLGVGELAEEEPS